MPAALIIYSAILAGLGVYAGHRLFLTATFWRVRRAANVPPAGLTKPTVTVQLPIFNERFVVERLIDAACALRWPRDRLQIQVLDDSTDDTSLACADAVARWKARGVDIEHCQRAERVGYKAGALQEGLAAAKGELVLILDADFVPGPDLLECAAGAFNDPRVGMVQVRWEHLNRHYSLLTEVQALLLDGHFGVEQVARSQTARLFNFNGTAGLWRRRAIDEAGGWQADTLTEDLDLSYRALLSGWVFHYLPDVAAPAELPVPMSGFKSQQFRWAKGSIQVAKKLLGRVARDRSLAWWQRVEAFFHLTQNVPYVLTCALAVAAVPALVFADRGDGVSGYVIDGALLVGTIGTLALYCAAAAKSVGASALAAFVRLPALIAVTAGISLSQTRAVLEGAFGGPSEFVRTPKSGVVGRKKTAAIPRRYRSVVGIIPLAEIALALYFIFGAIMAVVLGRYLAVPALATFALGFGYVGCSSLLGR